MEANSGAQEGFFCSSSGSRPVTLVKFGHKSYSVISLERK